MNKRLISRLMKERVSGLKMSGTYFLRGDFEQILQGVALEYVPKGVYIWNFRFPLFDFFGPHLTYSNRLKERPFVGNGEMPEQKFVEFIFENIEVQKIFSKEVPMSVADFIESNLLNFDHRRNPHLQLIQAAALVFLGKDAQALAILEALPNILHPRDVPHCNQLRASLQQGHEKALALLGDVRKKNLMDLGL